MPAPAVNRSGHHRRGGASRRAANSTPPASQIVEMRLGGNRRAIESSCVK
jgi:hypothetical protein